MDEVPIKVAVRVRPLVGQETVYDVNTCVHCIPSKPQLILGKDRGFTFDFVFEPQTTQADVYEACVEPLVKSCLHGYNATVFAYGQTGSGKTYTMGSQGTGGFTDSEYGIIPRAVKQIFHIIEESKNKVEFEVHVSYIEIYLEELRDLLELETSSKEMHIRENEKGNTVVIGATEQLVETIDDVMSCLDTGSAARQTGTTNMNEESSRSHAIFTLYIVQKPINDENQTDSLATNTEQEDTTDVDYNQFKYAKFHFVDLAGSERADRTGNVGERFKESVQINSGLLALGNVISSLADSKKKILHVPYRQSKVTRLLKDSLGGNARTVMITCLSPAEQDFAENLNSLKYATRARNIRNKPVINRDPQNTRLVAMQNQIMALRQELERRRSAGAPPMDVAVDKTQEESTQNQLQRYREVCQAYIECTVSASSQLRSLYAARAMTKQQGNQYEEWMKNLDQLTTSKTLINHDDADYWKMVGKLKSETKKYKANITSDEEVFTKQSSKVDSLRREIRDLEDKNKSLVQQLNTLAIAVKNKDDQLFEQQLQLNQNALKDNARISRGRANTAPTNTIHWNDSRKLHSPSIMSADQMIQGFRARSQLLSKKYEEKDEVLCEMSDSSESEDEDDDNSRGLGRTWKIRKKQGEQTHPIPLSTQLIRQKNSGDNILDELRSSTQIMDKEVRQTEVRVEDAQHKLRDLTINIRQKEKLIQDLIKSEQQERKMKEHFSKKVDSMKHEVELARKDFEEARRALDEMASKANVETSDKLRVEQELKKNLHLMETKLQALQRKQKDSERVNVFHEEKEKKVKELETHIERMRSQQETLNKRLKAESDKKTRLERDIGKHLQRIKELEEQANQQQKVIRRKTEQVANAQRRLRGIGKQGSDEKPSDDDIDLKKKRQWLDAEVEKVLQQKQTVDSLEEELKKREEIVKRKEAMLNEKNELEMKKMRSSQILSKDILRLSTQLMKVEQEIKEKEDVSVKTQGKDDLRGLVQTRDELNKQRNLLEDKLKAGELLDPNEEGRLIELDEGIEALEVAIDYKTDNIQAKERQLRSSGVLKANALKKEIHSLDQDEATNLLEKYLDKVIQLRQNERHLQIESNDKEVRINELERIVGELQRGLQQSVMVAERKATKLQQEHEQKVQFLMSQLNDAETGGEVKESDKDTRTQQLEKDLYYYKKTCRELKKKLREKASLPTQESTESTDYKSDDTLKARKEFKQSMTTSSARSASTSLKHSTSSTKNFLPPVSQTSSFHSATQSSLQSTLKQSENLEEIHDSIHDSIETGNNPWT